MNTVEAGGLPIGDDHPPRVMGVLNVSVESPYDPSVYADPGEAAEYVDQELIAEGADIVDVGLESANKRLDVLSAEEELDRLETAVGTIESVDGDAVFSIETRYAEVADRALSRGFDLVNDVCGFADPEMPAVCRDHDAAVVKMASPPDLERPGAIADVDGIYEALQRGELTDKTIVDPAFGGWTEDKTLADDRETFRRLREFRGLDRPILVSINRKNFLGEVVDRPTEKRLPASLAATAMAVDRGVHVLRTHDVEATVDAARIGAALGRDRLRSADRVGLEEHAVTTQRELRRHLDRLGADADPAGGIARAFELSGLDRDGIETLNRGATRAGATLAAGGDGDRALLFGTEQALADAAGALDELAASEDLRGLADSIRGPVDPRR